MTNSSPPDDESRRTPTHGGSKRRALIAGIVIAVLAVGAAAGAGGTRLAQRWQPQSVMLLQPTSIDRLQDDSPVSAKGRVTEIFGNKFILQDDSGRALVDLGPRGEGGEAVSQGETITVQGRFDRGVIHAQVVSHPDGRSESFGPPRPPRPGRGPERGPDRGPPPPDAPPPAPPER